MASGRIVIDVERCKGCELCQHACPPELITMADTFNAKGYRPAVLVDPEHDCSGCALCAVVCPEGCITVYRDQPQPRARRGEQRQKEAAV